jgi:hypothetical protein
MCVRTRKKKGGKFYFRKHKNEKYKRSEMGKRVERTRIYGWNGIFIEE